MTPDFYTRMVEKAVAAKAQGMTQAETLRIIEIQSGKANEEFHPEGPKLVEGVFNGTIQFAADPADIAAAEETIAAENAAETTIPLNELMQDVGAEPGPEAEGVEETTEATIETIEETPV